MKIIASPNFVLGLMAMSLLLGTVCALIEISTNLPSLGGLFS
jgi:hypothetical protein